MKHRLRVKHYFRYADDFIIVHCDQDYLRRLVPLLANFLKMELNLELHPHKISIRKLHQGIDFLGLVILPHHVVLRNKTKRRMFKKLQDKERQLLAGQIDQQAFNQSMQSYLGLLQHCNAHRLETEIKHNFEHLNRG